jgi:hypothetical protein
MTLEQTAAAIMYGQTFLFGTGFLLTLFRIKKRPHYVQVLSILFLLSALSDLAAQVLFRLKINPNYAGSAYDIISFPVLTLIYFFALNRKYARVFSINFFIFSFLSITNLLFIQGSSINSYSKMLCAVLIIHYAIYYFYWLIKELPTTNLYSLPMFWINSAFLVYYSGNFFLFAFTGYLVNVLNNNLLLYWTMHNLLGMTQCIMLIVAVLVDLTNTRVARIA